MINQNITPVSVVCTCYNQGRFAERAIKSVALQNYPKDKIQLIVIDDGSSDNSVELIKEALASYTRFKDKQLIQKENGGTASARNAGIKASVHNVVAFLDIDDEYHPDKLEESVKALLQYNNVGVVYSDYIEITEEGKKQRVFKPPFNRNMLMQRCIVSTNSVVDKEVFKRVGLFDESIKKCEDYDLWLRIAALFMIRHIPMPLFTYYNHGENKTAVSSAEDWQREEEKIKARAMRGQYFVSN